METFGQRLKRLREAAGKTRLELADYVGITRTSIALLENGQSGSMKGKNLLRASEFIGVSPEVLEYGDGGDPNRRTKAVAVRARKSPAAVHQIPVIGFAVANPIEDGYYEDASYPPGHGDGYVAWPTRDPNAYALRVRGDSMQPRIRPGEVIVVEPNATVTPGADVVVRCKDGRKMVKQLLFERGHEVTLGSINMAHRQVTIPREDIESIHYVSAIVPNAIVSESSEGYEEE